MTDAALPEIRTADDLHRHDGAQARVFGRYTQVDVRMRAVGAPQLLGHVALVLADGTPVALLPIWRPEARRPAAELARLDGQDVAAVGTIHAEAPAEPNGGASPLDPCLDPVTAIELAG